MRTTPGQSREVVQLLHILAHQATATDVLQSISLEMKQRLLVSGGGKDLEDLCESICDGLKQIRHANYTIEESLLDAEVLHTVDWVHGLNRLMRACHERNVPREQIEQLEIFLADALELEEELMEDGNQGSAQKQLSKISEIENEIEGPTRRRHQLLDSRGWEDKLVMEKEKFRLERAQDQAILDEMRNSLEEQRAAGQRQLTEAQLKWSRERAEIENARRDEKSSQYRNVLVDRRGEREMLFRHKNLLEDALRTQLIDSKDRHIQVLEEQIHQLEKFVRGDSVGPPDSLIVPKIQRQVEMSQEVLRRDFLIVKSALEAYGSLDTLQLALAHAQQQSKLDEERIARLERELTEIQELYESDRDKWNDDLRRREGSLHHTRKQLSQAHIANCVAEKRLCVLENEAREWRREIVDVGGRIAWLSCVITRERQRRKKAETFAWQAQRRADSECQMRDRETQRAEAKAVQLAEVYALLRQEQENRLGAVESATDQVRRWLGSQHPARIEGQGVEVEVQTDGESVSAGTGMGFIDEVEIVNESVRKEEEKWKTEMERMEKEGEDLQRQLISVSATLKAELILKNKFAAETDLLRHQLHALMSTLQDARTFGLIASREMSSGLAKLGLRLDDTKKPAPLPSKFAVEEDGFTFPKMNWDTSEIDGQNPNGLSIQPNDSWLNTSLGVSASVIEPPSPDSPSAWYNGATGKFSPNSSPPPRSASQPSKSAGEIVNDMLARVPGILGHLQTSSPERAAHLMDLVTDIHASHSQLLSRPIPLPTHPLKTFSTAVSTPAIGRAATPFTTSSWAAQKSATSVSVTSRLSHILDDSTNSTRSGLSESVTPQSSQQQKQQQQQQQPKTRPVVSMKGPASATTVSGNTYIPSSNGYGFSRMLPFNDAGLTAPNGIPWC